MKERDVLVLSEQTWGLIYQARVRAKTLRTMCYARTCLTEIKVDVKHVAAQRQLCSCRTNSLRMRKQQHTLYMERIDPQTHKWANIIT